MEIADKVSALEEEVKLLKGEIKAILQDVRTALLARDNPFDSDTFSMFAASAPEPRAFIAAPEPVAPAPHLVLVDPEPATVQAAPIVMAAPVAQPVAPAPAAVEAVHATANDEAEPAHRRWTIQEMAVLMGWAQTASESFNQNDMGIVLSLARYGGLISSDLESTLAELALSIGAQPVDRKATVNDFLLILRQLDAALAA